MTAVKMLVISAMVSLAVWGCAGTPAPEGYEYAYVQHGKTCTRELVSQVNPPSTPGEEAKIIASANPSQRGDTFAYIPQGKQTHREVLTNVVLAPPETLTVTERSDPHNPEPGSYYTIMIQGKQPVRVLVHDIK